MELLFEFIKFIILALGIVAISKYLLVPVLRKISKLLNLSAKATGNITGFATSVPELLTVVFSSTAGFIGTSIYNIVSSNIINLVQYIFSIYLNKNQKFLSNKAILIDLILVAITIIIPIGIVGLGITMDIKMVIVFVLLLIIFYYINHNVHKLYLEKEDQNLLEEIENEEITQEKNRGIKTILYFIYLILIAIALYVIGEFLSKSLTNLSNIFGLPEFILGILLGVITSIPELITFIESQRKEKSKNSEYADKLGVVEATNNLLTSNILNLFAIQSIGIIVYTLFG